MVKVYHNEKSSIDMYEKMLRDLYGYKLNKFDVILVAVNYQPDLNKTMTEFIQKLVKDADLIVVFFGKEAEKSLNDEVKKTIQEVNAGYFCTLDMPRDLVRIIDNKLKKLQENKDVYL